MRKVLVLTIIAALLVLAFAGCSKEGPNEVKTGLAVITSISNSSDVEDGVGTAQVDSTVVAVTVDNDGRIVKCVIDAAQTRANFNGSGEITTPLNQEFKAKNELGDGYNMKNASSIGKEWYEQAAAFAKYAEGKTAGEIAGIAVDESKHPTGADLKSSVTISIGDFIEGVQKAINNAQSLGAKGEDKLGIGVVTSIGNSTNATSDEDGVVEVYSHYSATTVGKDGKITSSVIDASQTKVSFDQSGKITADLNAEQKTKNELGDGYNMKNASSIGKEWYEQAAAFAKYVKGNSADDVGGIAVDDTGHAAKSDLKSSVTVTIGGFKTVVEKAAKAAK
jgi:outer membrane protein assembly factor BamE (lipoprotein component of BamABCDE complex)